MIRVEFGTAKIKLKPGITGTNDGGGTIANYNEGDLAMAAVAVLRAMNCDIRRVAALMVAVAEQQGPPK